MKTNLRYLRILTGLSAILCIINAMGANDWSSVMGWTTAATFAALSAMLTYSIR